MKKSAHHDEYLQSFSRWPEYQFSFVICIDTTPLLIQNLHKTCLDQAKKVTDKKGQQRFLTDCGSTPLYLTLVKFDHSRVYITETLTNIDLFPSIFSGRCVMI
jgi:hypothetical protein